ncbi:MAG: MarR family transcriptional regulator [Crocinitomicaceae bacterium]|nr:MarR family transcriptional regulator [Crocinitomicaceae bacterium]
MQYTDILIAIRKIARAINLDSKRIQKVSGLSIPQLLSLTFISNCDDYQCSQLELRKFLQLNSSTVTGIVSRLISKGYIAKIPSKGDKRSTWLGLTALGLKQVENAPELFQEKLNAKLSQLPKQEIDIIENGLNMLIEILGEDNLSGEVES